jgi:hypothetical protein
MAKYKVMSSIGEGKEFMNGIEFDYVIDNEELGTEVKCMGGDFVISQNGKILVLTNPDWVLTIMKQPEPEEENVETFDVNKDWDMFFEDKTFKIHDTPLTRKRITYEDFFEAVREEWKNVEKLRTDPFPMKYDYGFKSLVFTHGWGWASDDFKYLIEGSWGREDKDGRSI